MKKYVNKTDIIYIKPLFVIAVCLGLSPPCSLLQDVKFKSYMFYCVLVITVLICQTTISVYARYCTILKETTTTLIFTIDFITSIVITAFLCIAISKSISKNKKFQLFINIFKQFDNSQNLLIESYKRFLIQFIISHILITVFYIYNMYVTIKTNGFGMFIKTSPRVIDHYLLIILTMLVSNFAISIKSRLKWLNNTLKNTQKSLIMEDDDREETECSWKDIQKIRKLYCQLSKSITVFNEIFGWQILGITIAVSLGFLETINTVITILVYGAARNVPSNFIVIVLTFSWCTSFLVSSKDFVLFSNLVSISVFTV